MCVCVCVCARVHFNHTVLMCAKSLWLYSTLYNPVYGSPPGSSVHGIFQASILEWVVMASSRRSSRPRDQTCISYITCFGR